MYTYVTHTDTLAIRMCMGQRAARVRVCSTKHSDALKHYLTSFDSFVSKTQLAVGASHILALVRTSVSDRQDQ